MQKATFAITIPHIASRLYLQSLHSMQKLNHTSITSRFCVHGTFQINQSNSLIFNPIFIRVTRNHIVHACRQTGIDGKRY